MEEGDTFKFYDTESLHMYAKDIEERLSETG